MSHGRVCAVVVTWNRKALLRECLAGLLRQTRAPEQILVIDNHSTDGTPDMVRQEFPSAVLHETGSNLGGAGGFHHGMKRAHEEGFDWIWVMDDDIEPYPEALERLLAHSSRSDLLHLRRDGLDRWEGIWNPGNLCVEMFDREYSFENGKPYTVLRYATFEGALIHRRIVDAIGLPDVRCFVSSDDALFGYFASFHTDVLYINELGFRRKLPLPKLGRMSAYLYLRNRHLIWEAFTKTGIVIPARHFWLMQLGLATRTWTSVRAIWEGLRDGRRGVFGPPPWLRA
jgi:rhamnopyranosyl-N-acetylglucosaminyl-diphospho-decaprenol beta-1,3/1,4-galactofuranosyltransferase